MIEEGRDTLLGIVLLVLIGNRIDSWSATERRVSPTRVPLSHGCSGGGRGPTVRAASSWWSKARERPRT